MNDRKINKAYKLGCERMAPHSTQSQTVHRFFGFENHFVPQRAAADVSPCTGDVHWIWHLTTVSLQLELRVISLQIF